MNDAKDISGRELSKTYWIATSLLGFTMLVFIPVSLFLGNRNEFTVGIADLISFLIPLLAVFAGAAATTFILIGKKHRIRFAAIISAIAILVWFQGNVLVWNYGPLDGRMIEWQTHVLHGVFDSIIWFILLTFAIVRPQSILKGASAFSTILIISSFAMLAFNFVDSQDNTNAPVARDFQIDDSEKFHYSADQNVVLVVLDAFQADIFQEVTNDSEYASVFDGFTFFPNAVAGSNFTHLSVPALLTGQLYDNSLARSEFIRGAYIDFGITTLMQRAGFRVDIFPWLGWGNETILFDEAIANNLVRRNMDDVDRRVFSEQNAKEVLHLIDLTLFRISPHFLKRYVYNDQKWLAIRIATALAPASVKQTISTDNQYETIAFVQESKERTRRSTRPKTFQYYHLKGAHRPLSVDGQLAFTNETIPFNRENYTNSVKANIAALGDYLALLKELELFDNSLIVIVGDHGSGNTADLYIGEQTGPDGAANQRNFNKDKARGVPLFLIKRFNSSGDMSQNLAPVALSDVPATIIGELDLQLPSTGQSVFAIEEDSTRVRLFGAFDYNANRSDYVGPLTIYEVNGHSWDSSSWSVKSVQKPGDPPLTFRIDDR